MQNRGEISEYTSDGRLTNIGKSHTYKKREKFLCGQIQKKERRSSLLKVDLRTNARTPVW